MSAVFPERVNMVMAIDFLVISKFFVDGRSRTDNNGPSTMQRPPARGFQGSTPWKCCRRSNVMTTQLHGSLLRSAWNGGFVQLGSSTTPTLAPLWSPPVLSTTMTEPTFDPMASPNFDHNTLSEPWDEVSSYHLVVLVRS
jgi:hypothetical protein